MTHSDKIAANKRLWETWAEHHVDSDFYDTEGFKAGRDPLDPVVTEGVGDVSGKSLLHLQCHFGTDTLGFARRGASVVGVDFSENAVSTATALAEELGLDARFLLSDVRDALDVLGGETFDIVFTSYGAISWLPDLNRWAAVIAGALKPGGRFFIAEHHPFVWVYDDEATEPELRFRYPYFSDAPVTEENTGSYAVPDGTFKGVSHSWQHTFEDIINALAGEGLRIESLHEYPYLAFQWFEFMTKGPDGFWRLPDGMPDIPLMFTLTASKDA